MSKTRKCRSRHRPVDGDRVARDAGLGTGQEAILTDEAVDQGRLAGVRAADDGDLHRFRSCLALLLTVRRFAEDRGDCVLEIAHSLAVLGRDRQRRADAE